MVPLPLLRWCASLSPSLVPLPHRHVCIHIRKHVHVSISVWRVPPEHGADMKQGHASAAKTMSIGGRGQCKQQRRAPSAQHAPPSPSPPTHPHTQKACLHRPRQPLRLGEGGAPERKATKLCDREEREKPSRGARGRWGHKRRRCALRQHVPSRAILARRNKRTDRHTMHVPRSATPVRLPSSAYVQVRPLTLFPPSAPPPPPPSPITFSICSSDTL